jgi:hypothetical protein
MSAGNCSMAPLSINNSIYSIILIYLISMSEKLARLIEKLNEQADLLDKLLNSRLNYKYKSIERLVLEVGRGFTDRKIVPNKAKSNVCYENCFKAIMFNKDYNYCEGYFVYDDINIAIAHAWLVDKEDNVIDITLEDELAGAVYFGIVFNRDFVLHMGAKLKYYGILDSDHMLEHEFKKNGFPEGAIINQLST